MLGDGVVEVIGVAGFIKPNDRVDVMVTLDQTVLNGRPTSKVILENIKVLAAGTEMVRGEKDEEAKIVQVMTLEVDVQEAEKLALASGKKQYIRSHLEYAGNFNCGFDDL